jgi:hypothetical protein
MTSDLNKLQPFHRDTTTDACWEFAVLLLLHTCSEIIMGVGYVIFW